MKMKGVYYLTKSGSVIREDLDAKRAVVAPEDVRNAWVVKNANAAKKTALILLEDVRVNALGKAVAAALLEAATTSTQKTPG